MTKYTRGPQINTVDDAVFCIRANDHIYHDRAILPGCQLKSWSLDKLIKKVENGRLFKAEFGG